MRVRDLEDGDRPWLRALIEAAWSLPVVTPIGSYDDPTVFDGVVAELDGQLAGAVTYRADDDLAWEIVTVNATVPRRGVATALMTAVRERASAAGAQRAWLITTDDNPGAIDFYEAIGMRRVRAYENFVEVVRATKPGIGGFRNAIEFEWVLTPEA